MQQTFIVGAVYNTTNVEGERVSPHFSGVCYWTKEMQVVLSVQRWGDFSSWVIQQEVIASK